MFFDDLLKVLQHAEIIKYADDTILYVAGKDIFIIATRLSADMQSLNRCYTEHEMILNFSKGKTEAMLFGTSKNLAKQEDTFNVE